MAQNSGEKKRRLIRVTYADGAAVPGDALVADIDVEIPGGNVHPGTRTDGDVGAAGGALQTERADGGIGITGRNGVQSVVAGGSVLSSARQTGESVITVVGILIGQAADGGR